MQCDQLPLTPASYFPVMVDCILSISQMKALHLQVLFVTYLVTNKQTTTGRGVCLRKRNSDNQSRLLLVCEHCTHFLYTSSLDPSRSPMRLALPSSLFYRQANLSSAQFIQRANRSQVRVTSMTVRHQQGARKARSEVTQLPQEPRLLLGTLTESLVAPLLNSLF